MAVKITNHFFNINSKKIVNLIIFFPGLVFSCFSFHVCRLPSNPSQKSKLQVVVILYSQFTIYNSLFRRRYHNIPVLNRAVITLQVNRTWFPFITVERTAGYAWYYLV